MFVALGIQHAMCMRQCPLWPALLYSIVQRYVINGTIKNAKIKSVFWFSVQLLSATFFIPIRTERIWSKVHIGLHVRSHPLFLSSVQSVSYKDSFRTLPAILPRNKKFIRIFPLTDHRREIPVVTTALRLRNFNRSVIWKKINETEAYGETK